MENAKTYKLCKFICDNANIVEIIGNYIELKKNGANYTAICCFHTDKNPSLFVNPKKKIWKCFVCGNGGNVIKFVQQFNKINNKNCSLLEACKIIADIAKLDISAFEDAFINTNLDTNLKYVYDCNIEASKIFKDFLHDKRNQRVIDYLNKRGLDSEIIKYFNLGYAPNNGNILFGILTNHNNMFGNSNNGIRI
jgi:DNA primase